MAEEHSSQELPNVYTVFVKDIGELENGGKLMSPAFKLCDMVWHVALHRRGSELDALLYGQLASAVALQWSVLVKLELELGARRYTDSHLFTGTRRLVRCRALLEWQQALAQSATGPLRLDVRIVWCERRGKTSLPPVVALQPRGRNTYLSSLVHALFAVRRLCDVVAALHVAGTRGAARTVTELCNVFRRLQLSDEDADCEQLAASYEADVNDATLATHMPCFVMQLLGDVRTVLAKTPHRGLVDELFTGQMSVQWYEGTGCVTLAPRNFTFLQLEIQGCRNIYEALEALPNTDSCALHGGSGGNGGDGDGYTFARLPPVLLVLLGPSSGYFEYYRQIALDTWMTVRGHPPATYVLQSVLLHCRDEHGADASVAYVDPQCHSAWLRFKDGAVTLTCGDAAIQDNYCAEPYMLVYVRHSALDSVLQLAQKRAERRRAGLYVQLFLEDQLYEHCGHGLFDSVAAHTYVLRVDKKLRSGELVRQVARAFHCDADALRLWPLQDCGPDCVRPRLLVPGLRPVGRLAANRDPWPVFVELAPARDVLPPHQPDQHVLLFFKEYNRETNQLRYCGLRHASLDDPITALLPALNALAGYPAGTALQLYEEVSERRLNKLYVLWRTLRSYELHDGAIIMFVREFRAARYLYMMSRLGRSEQVRLENYGRRDGEGAVTLSLPYGTTRLQLAQLLAANIGVRADAIHFRRHFRGAQFRDSLLHCTLADVVIPQQNSPHVVQYLVIDAGRRRSRAPPPPVAPTLVQDLCSLLGQLLLAKSMWPHNEQLAADLEQLETQCGQLSAVPGPTALQEFGARVRALRLLLEGNRHEGGSWLACVCRAESIARRVITRTPAAGCSHHHGFNCQECRPSVPALIQAVNLKNTQLE